MRIKDFIRQHVVDWEPPSKSGWDRLDAPDEDFAGEARAEVSTPKRGQR